MRLPFHFINDTSCDIPAGAVGVDSALPGVAVDLSHWQDGENPPGVVGDTGVEVAFSALAQAAVLQAAQCVVNDHIDADGLLAAALIATQPEGLDHRQRQALRDAAAVADFTEYASPDGLRVAITLHEMIVASEAAQGTNGNWQQACYDQLCAAWSTADGCTQWLAAALASRAVTDHAVAAIEDGIRRLRRGDQHQIHDHGQWWSISWQHQRGHRTDSYNQTEYADDCPLLSLSAIVPIGCYQLCSWRDAFGWQHCLDAPRYSWARTTRRPRRAWPDAAAVAALLSAQDAVTWQARPAVADLSFTGLLASGPGSQLAPQDVWPFVQQLLATVPAAGHCAGNQPQP